MGAVGTSNVAGGTSGVASAFSSTYNNFKKFCCEFLRQEILQVLRKVIVQVFSQFFFFFDNHEQVAAAHCRNTTPQTETLS